LLEKSLPSFISLKLEGKKLFDQYWLFQNAEVVVAQHGAALSNILFMREGTRVIEIGPQRMFKTYFSELAKTLGIEYSLMDQHDRFPVVNPDELLRLIKTA